MCGLPRFTDFGIFDAVIEASPPALSKGRGSL